MYANFSKETLAYNKSRTKISKLEAQLAQEKAQSKSWSTQVVVLQREIFMLREKLSLTDMPLVKVKTFTRKKENTSDVDNALSQQVIQLQKETSTLQMESIEAKARVVSLEQEKEAWKAEKDKLQRKIEKLKLPNSPTSQLIQDMSDVSLKDMEITKLKEKNQQLEEELTKNTTEDEQIQEVSRLNEKISKLKEKTKGVLQL